MLGIKGMKEIPTDCKKCRLMGTDGNPKDILSPMMCVAIWAIKHEVKHCIGGKVLDDCPLTEIITCENCNNHGISKEHPDIDGARYCSALHTYTGYDFYCKDGERKE